jgi:hypothetical protein
MDERRTSSPSHSIDQQNLTSVSSSSTGFFVSMSMIRIVCQSEPDLEIVVAQYLPFGLKLPQAHEAVPFPSLLNSFTSKKTSPDVASSKTPPCSSSTLDSPCD